MHGLEWIGFLVMKVISLQFTNVGRVQVFSLNLNTVAFLCVLFLSLGVIYILCVCWFCLLLFHVFAHNFPNICFFLCAHFRTIL
jgi:hypothetical protein